MYQITEKKKSNSRPVIQTSLKIGQPGDKYEQEADAVADRVMRMSEGETMRMQPKEEEKEMMQPKLRMQLMEEEKEMMQPKLRMQSMEEEEEMMQTKIQLKEKDHAQLKCLECEQEEMLQTQSLEQEEEILQTKRDNHNSTGISSISTKLNQNKNNGVSLPDSTNRFMSNLFGANFNSVRIHSENQAIQMNRQLGARAFTFGNHVYFNQGQFDPQSRKGATLLAHELTHTLQQGAVKREKGTLSNNNRTNQNIISRKEYDPGTAINVGYSVPLVNSNIEASPGESLIFRTDNVVDQDKERTGSGAWNVIAGTGPYETKFSVAGDAEFDSGGSGLISKTINSLNSGNIILVIKSAWTGASSISVTATLIDKAVAASSPDTGSTKDSDKTITWTIKKRQNSCPTGLTKVGGPGATWTAIPADYTYKATPDIPPAGSQDYENQTVLESFGPATALGFTMSDLTAAWKTANPTINTPDKVANFLWGTSGNGTFVFDAQDQISDRHNGFGTVSPFNATAFTDADGIGYKKTQTYSCSGTSIGTATIERRNTTANGVEVKKTGP